MKHLITLEEREILWTNVVSLTGVLYESVEYRDWDKDKKETFLKDMFDRSIDLLSRYKVRGK
ncbi:MAG: hypothetical protein CBD16_08225 [Betaproteobacteria bacterium TMED156]|jgi:hypothetical protein|nr:MAG: hypothetical protein CBD16_08225 [Betaproteobacteria bacterium TMED156]